MTEQTDDEQLFQDSIRAVEIMLGHARDMSLTYDKIKHCDPKFIRFGIQTNHDLMNALGDVMHGHDFYDEDDPNNDFIDSVFDRMEVKFPFTDEHQPSTGRMGECRKIARQRDRETNDL